MLDNYHRINQDNGRLHNENENLLESTDRLREENTALREQNRDFSLLLKVFGRSQGRKTQHCGNRTGIVDESGNMPLLIGDVWCYCIDMDDEPNCMLSFCLFELEYWSKGIATTAVKMFIQNICARYHVKTIGAFTFAHNQASIRVLEKNGFVVLEEFEEDGLFSKYLQLEC